MSERGLRLDGEKVLGDSVAFRFSAEIRQTERKHRRGARWFRISFNILI